MPSEILSNLIPQLCEDKPTLSLLAQVSESSRTLAEPLLWRAIRLSPFSSTQKTIYPATDYMPFRTSTSTPLEEEYQVMGSIGISDVVDKWIKPFIHHVKILEVEHHPMDWCRSWSATNPSPILPNLQTLHLLYNNDGLTSAIHPAFPNRECRLLNSLEPRTVVLDMPLVDGRNPISLSRSISRSTRELIFVFGPSMRLVDGDICMIDEGMMGDLNLNLQRITIVFVLSLLPKPQEGEEEEEVDEEAVEEAKRGLSNSTYLISIFMAFERIPFTIVNAGYNEKMRFENEKISMDVLDREAPGVFAERLYSMASAYGWTEEEIQERQDGLSFLTLEEWAERRDMWDGKIGGEKLQRWREAMNGI
ncbi:hypothetical protein I302_100402 [Kwoniella bestiolae CBS 10118]|uniref:F-box domain-containing protein n=1 Tax=Kwoniella bestiolae CBS 10118 TaxID=1296100 RepID=A0A1B9G526_9TREE|nr:hypothetical protein I302_03777 [Kwoniella bestiolae CBS 10118]OCF26100.1 hypothetical protein I302_03777 [Kwoniella bestiolae CBS 10118]